VRGYVCGSINQPGSLVRRVHSARFSLKSRCAPGRRPAGRLAPLGAGEENAALAVRALSGSSARPLQKPRCHGRGDRLPAPARAICLAPSSSSHGPDWRFGLDPRRIRERGARPAWPRRRVPASGHSLALSTCERARAISARRCWGAGLEEVRREMRRRTPGGLVSPSKRPRPGTRVATRHGLKW